MTQNNVLIEKHQLNYATINSIVRILNDSLKTDINLANDLLHFLNDHHITVPELSNKRNEQPLPVSFEKKASEHLIDQLKYAFEGIEMTESLI